MGATMAIHTWNAAIFLAWRVLRICSFFWGFGEPIRRSFRLPGEFPWSWSFLLPGPRDLEPDEFKRAHQICAFFCGFGEPTGLLWVWRAHQKFRGLGVSDSRGHRDLEPDLYNVY